MDGRTIQGLSPLLIRKNPAACSKVFAQARNLTNHHAIGEWAMRISILHDVLRQHSIQSGHSCQERRRRGVHIHPTAFTQSSTVASAISPAPAGSRHVDTVLPRWIWVDLDQLGQRILQSARNRHSTAQTDIQASETPAAANAEASRRTLPLRSRRFCHLLFRLPFGHQFDDFDGQLVRLTTRCAIADRHQFPPCRMTRSMSVARAPASHCEVDADRSWWSRGVCLWRLPRHFAAGADPRVESEHRLGPAGAASNSSWRLRPKILIASAAASRTCSNSSVLKCKCTLTRQAQ